MGGGGVEWDGVGCGWVWSGPGAGVPDGGAGGVWGAHPHGGIHLLTGEPLEAEPQVVVRAPGGLRHLCQNDLAAAVHPVGELPGYKTAAGGGHAGTRGHWTQVLSCPGSLEVVTPAGPRHLGIAHLGTHRDFPSGAGRGSQQAGESGPCSDPGGFLGAAGLWSHPRTGPHQGRRADSSPRLGLCSLQMHRQWWVQPLCPQKPRPRWASALVYGSPALQGGRAACWERPAWEPLTHVPPSWRPRRQRQPGPGQSHGLPPSTWYR